MLAALMCRTIRRPVIFCSTCRHLRTQSTRKATLNLARIYMAAKYVFRVQVTSGQGLLTEEGYNILEVVVKGSYGSIHIDTGQIIIYFILLTVLL